VPFLTIDTCQWDSSPAVFPVNRGTFSSFTHPTHAIKATQLTGWRKLMPLINTKLIEGVFTPKQKQEKT
jgi:hypothetical protein